MGAFYKLVLRAMRLHPEEFHIQMAATACVYNLTKGDVGQKIHPHILKEVVHFTLAAMENFPNHLQVDKVCKTKQKNSFV